LSNLAPLIILASARKHSDTQKLVELVFKDIDITLVDLLDYKIAQYNYEEEYPTDDEFLKVVEQMLTHQLIVFATPVYWYAMSGYMKVFFDRLTDIVSSQKHLGRKLKGKRAALIAVSTDEELPEGFEVPFKRTAEYFDMEYSCCFFSPAKAINNPTQMLIQQAGEWRRKILK
jgi:multimeric flavodoxin WrbA